MASFCGSCGSPVGGQSEFCGNCGARAGQSPPQPAAGVPAAAAPAAGSSGKALRMILIGVGVLFALGVLSVAGIYFTARHYVKIAENVTGVKAGDVVSSIRESAARSSDGAKESKRDGCLLLSKEEASAILGVQVERVDGKPNDRESGEHCDFFVKPETNQQNLDKFKQAAAAVKFFRGSVKARESVSAPTPEQLYDLACTRAKLAGAAADSGSHLSPAEARAEADQAMAVLRRAVTAGFNSAEKIQKDTDLESLHNRNDFKKLMQELQQPKKPAEPSKSPAH